jgi:hypothetical protein
MNGPYYSLEDACKKLSISISELRHLITSREIYPVVYTKKRSFLIHTRNGRDNWIGHAICLYRGHLIIASDHIATLLSGEHAEFQKGAGRILEPESLLTWQTAYPFKKTLPSPPLNAWEPIEQHEVEISKVLATPLPIEAHPAVAGITKIAEILGTIAQARNVSISNEITSAVKPFHELDDLKLYFDNNGTLEPDCLRITNAEILRYENRRAKPKEARSAPKEYKVAEDGKRENQLHSLIGRILNDYPDIKPKTLEKIIRAEASSDEPNYDHDNILGVVDSSGIAWESRHANEGFLKWISLSGLLSKLRSRNLTKPK